MKAALLPDRGVVKVAGDDARTFLNGMLTTDVTKVTPERARFGALLTPQGKIIVDCIVAEAAASEGGGFFLDCPKALALDFVKKLNFYKLRAKVICEDLSEVLGIMAVWDGQNDTKEADTDYGLDEALPKNGVDAATAGALYNYFVMARGSALGVHNPVYSGQVLYDSIQAVGGDLTNIGRPSL